MRRQERNSDRTSLEPHLPSPFSLASPALAPADPLSKSALNLKMGGGLDLRSSVFIKINAKSTLSFSLSLLSFFPALFLSSPHSAGEAKLLVVPPRAEVVVEEIEVQARLKRAGDPH